ncbi:MAG: sensor histidine kinase [Ignavibacteriaceae bacterium]
MKSNFLANMSHELRTPLIGILGFAEILNKEIEYEELKGMAKIIYSSGNRLLQTLNLVLDFSRIESDKYEMKVISLDLAKATIDTAKLFYAMVNVRNLYLKINIKDDSLFANLDENIFHQIINNLVNNAIKFTSDGGIVVELDKEIINDKLWAAIKVIDTGIGIPEESIQIIFEEFRQVSEGLNRNYEGTGLGLTITKKIVELMNGRITVESVYGKGSKFTVYFPAELKKLI